jgi:magnesium transporter
MIKKGAAAVAAAAPFFVFQKLNPRLFLMLCCCAKILVTLDKRSTVARILGWHRGFDKKKGTQQESSIQEALGVESIAYNDLTWVNIESPTKREIEWLAQNYQFHTLALDDCLSRKQISKLDVYPGYLFFVFHYPIYNKETRIAAKQQWSAFIGENYLVTIHTRELKTTMALFRDCQANEESRKEYMSGGSGFLLYRLLDRAIDAYFPVLDKILSLMEDVEEIVFDENTEAARELSILRRDIITQRAVMFPTRNIFIQMENKLKRFSKVDVTDYYDDLMDHANKICNTLDEAKETIEVFKDSDYTLATYRVNDILRVLTILATIGTVLTVVASFYGMNVDLPGGSTPKAGFHYTWVVLLVIMVAVMGTMLYYFHRKHWL